MNAANDIRETREKQGGEESVHYILKDHLGSWTTITDSEGIVEQELSYDAWGSLRNPATWSGNFSGTPMFDRGFTGHEHMTAFGLINMNGRCYDPLTSSFLSVDAYVQNPTSAQSFNRYAYCGYNPLRYTDPTGWLPDATNPIRQCNGANYNDEPRWHSNDLNDMLWGRSVHPCETGNSNKSNTTISKYSVGNNGTKGNKANKFYSANGKYLGTDGKYEGKVFIVNNVRSEVIDMEVFLYQISNKEIARFIKNNNGDPSAFTDDCIAYANSFEIPSLENRIQMIENVSKDTGKDRDALLPSNNKEYGGAIGSDVVFESDVKSPKYNRDISIDLPADCNTYHSHPSGFIYEEIGGNVGGEAHTYSFQQYPSLTDISNCGNYNCFVIGRGDGYVYGYNSTGIHVKVKTLST